MVSKKVRTLYVSMNGTAIGELRKRSTGALEFTYDDNWLLSSGARPISNSMPLRHQPFKEDLVYNFVDNLLPDNPRIRARIQARFQVETSQPFDLLASIGHDCVGAIQFSEIKNAPFPKKIEGTVLNDSDISQTLKAYHEAPLGMLKENEDFRISIAGAQEKTALLFHENKWQRPLGTTPSTHILKLPIGFVGHQGLDLRDSCENEWICCEIARAFGLPVSETKIQIFSDVKVLVVKRFDRKYSTDNSWIVRLPQEDMCQALGYSPNVKYQSDGGPGISDIMNILQGSYQSKVDRDIFFQSQILFWLLAAIDGHAKNFSLFLEAGNKYRLTPLYDIMSAHPLVASRQLQKQKIKMAMALKRKNAHYRWYDLQRNLFLSAANNARYSTERAELLLEEMLGKIDTVIDEVSKNLPADFPNKISQPIFDGMLFAKSVLVA